jgi:hypothetical protein
MNVTELAEQRGMLRPDIRVRVGDIVQLTWQRRLVYARVLSWSGQPDAHVKLVDLRCLPHRRYVDSLVREIPAAELPSLVARFDELLASKKGQAVLKPVKSEWQELPNPSHGQPSVHDEPLKTTTGFSSEPSRQLLRYVGTGNAERRYLAELCRRDPETYRRTIAGSYPGQRRFEYEEAA